MLANPAAGGGRAREVLPSLRRFATSRCRWCASNFRPRRRRNLPGTPQCHRAAEPRAVGHSSCWRGQRSCGRAWVAGGSRRICVFADEWRKRLFGRGASIDRRREQALLCGRRRRGTGRRSGALCRWGFPALARTLTILAGRDSRLDRLPLHSRSRATGELGTQRVRRFPIRWVRIETDRPCLFHGDGEILGPTPVEISVLPRAVAVLRPAVARVR